LLLAGEPISAFALSPAVACVMGITLHFTLINKERCQKVSILALTLIVGLGEMLSCV
jgi:hypothetical protein